jgi:hypothetical protein
MTKVIRSEDITVAEFREQLEVYFDKLVELLTLFPNTTGVDYLAKISDLRQQTMNLPDNQLMIIYEGVKNHTIWYEFVPLVDSIKAKAEQIKIPVDTAERVNCPVDSCSDSPNQVDVDNLLIGVASADLATSIAQGVAAAIPQEILGIPNPAYIAAVVAATALDATAKSLAIAAATEQRDADVNGKCQDDAHADLLRNVCEGLQTVDAKVDTLNVKVDIINGKLDSLTGTVNVINANVNEILLRQIEYALAQCQTMVSLYLPQAFGGRLETVQTLVQALIARVAAAGLEVCEAQCFYDRAVEAIGEKDYKKALNCLMAAYQQLLRCSC